MPPPDGVLAPGAPKPPTGCDYEPCKNAVCECDSYCCDTAWDLSCRGYYMKQGDTIENNYFVPGCSAKLLCCEQESAFPDPPIGAAMAGATNLVQVNPAFAAVQTSFACTPGTKGCCDTMIPPSYLPPDDSTCWQWWDPPADGVMKPDMPEPPKGCDYSPCQDAVCACDSYCCDVAWDMSCRGYAGAQGDATENNYFVDNCSAKILCCEDKLAVPVPQVGGATVPIVSPISFQASQPAGLVTVSTKVIEVPVAAPPSSFTTIVEVPVPGPISVSTKVIEVPVPVPNSVTTKVIEVPLPVPVSSVKQILVPVPVPVAVKVVKQVLIPVPVPVVPLAPKLIPVPVPVPVIAPVAPKVIPLPVPVPG